MIGFRLIISITILLLSTVSFGAGDWKSTQGVDPIFQKDICRASTLVTAAGLSIEYSMVFAKDKSLAPVVLATARGPQVDGTEIELQWTDNRGKPAPQRMILLSNTDQQEGASQYWLYPKDLPETIQRIRNYSRVNVLFKVPGQTPLPAVMSLRGSSATLDQTLNCLKASSFGAKQFYDLLSKDPAGLSPDPAMTTLELYQKVQELYTQFQSSLNLDQEIKKLREGSKNLLNKEAMQIKDYSLKQKNLDAHDAKITSTQNDLSQTQVLLEDLQKKLSQLILDESNLKTDIQSKEVTYLPLKKQEQIFAKQVSTAKDRLEAIERRIRYVNRVIAENPGIINSLKNENAVNERRISSLRSDLRLAEDIRDRAREERSRFREDYEFQKRLSDDWSYRMARNDYERAEQAARQSEQQLSSAQSQLSSAQGDLQRCKSDANANCSSYESQVNQANQQVQQYAQQLNHNRNQMSSAQWQMERAESSVRDSVNRIVRDLNEKLRDAESKVDDIESDISSLRYKISQNENSIQELRSEYSSAVNEKPGLLTKRDSAIVDLNVAKGEYEKFDQANNFTAIENAYLQAKKQLAETQSGIIKIKKDIPLTQKKIQNIQANLLSLQKQRINLLKLRDRSLAALNSTQELLKPMREQEKILIDQRAQLQVLMDSKQIEVIRGALARNL